MERSIYRYIWRYSKRQQIVVLILTLITFPLLYLSLEVPKIIINEALGDERFPRDILGIEIEQVAFLLTLCFIYLALVVINGVIKMRVNIYKGGIAERMMRRLRYQLVDRVLRFPRPHFRKVTQGELIPIVTAEVEPLGGLMGDAVGQPLLLSGQMLTILTFLFVQNPWLGLSAVALIPLQAYVIPKLQRQVNQLHREKVKRVRRLSERLSETVTGINDIHMSATTAYTRADFSHRLGGIFQVRFEMFKKKYFMKFINNLMNNLTPFFFYAIGGYLVIRGELTLGALVAALAAYKDLISPWKELLNFYNLYMDSSIRYDAIIEKFDPKGLVDEGRQTTLPDPIPRLEGNIKFSNVSWDDEGVRVLRSVSLTIEGGTAVAVVGPDDAGRERLAQIISRTLSPDSGNVTMNGENLETMPETVTGARIAYIGPDSHVFSVTVADNLRLNLKRLPPIDVEETDKRRAEVAEAMAAGNSPHPFDVDWVDYQRNGFRDANEFKGWWLQVIRALRAEDYLFEKGLDVHFDPSTQPALATRFLEARGAVGLRLAEDQDLATLVKRFDPDEYNSYASVAENILFGVPTDKRLSPENLYDEPYLREVLDACNLTARFTEIGVELVNLVLEMFEDLPPGHPFYERYNFVDEEWLPQLRDVQLRVMAGIDNLSRAELQRLTAAPLLLIHERHRLGLIDDDMREALLGARRYFHDHMPENLRGALVPFDADVYLPTASVLTNVLGGRIAFSVAGAERRVRTVVGEILDALGMREDVVNLVNGLQTGVGGSLLTIPGRERVTFARALAKRPDVVVMNQALASFTDEQRVDALREVRKLLPDATMIWLDKTEPADFDFDEVFQLRDGRVQSLQVGREPQVEEAEPKTIESIDAELEQMTNIPLFSAVPHNELKLLRLASEKQVVKAGEVLFELGDRSDGVYAIIDGELDMIRAGDGGERVLARLGARNTVGELDVICDRPRSATARATKATTVLFIAAEDVHTLITRHADTANAMLRYVSERLRATVEEQMAA